MDENNEQHYIVIFVRYSILHFTQQLCPHNCVYFLEHFKCHDGKQNYRKYLSNYTIQRFQFTQSIKQIEYFLLIVFGKIGLVHCNYIESLDIVCKPKSWWFPNAFHYERLSVCLTACVTLMGQWKGYLGIRVITKFLRFPIVNLGITYHVTTINAKTKLIFKSEFCKACSTHP